MHTASYHPLRPRGAVVCEAISWALIYRTNSYKSVRSSIDKAAKKLEAMKTDSSSSAATTTTALKWVTWCCPELPRILVQKLFRLRQAATLAPTFEDNHVLVKLLKHMSAHSKG
ncbi:hypothetical protein PS2_046797 [Malus domestica]